MSYGIVRVQKMTSGSVKGIEIHDRREKDKSHTNPDIDFSRSEQNYDLCPKQNENFYQAVKERIDSLHLKKAVRKDAVVMAQVLVTSDGFFFEEMKSEAWAAASHSVYASTMPFTPSMIRAEYEKNGDPIKEFFQDAYDFLVERYGEENVISATVHLDEATPHMHFNFVPVTKDGRLCAKDVLKREALIDQQDKFHEQVGQKYGLLRGEGKDSGKDRKHRETAEYKRITSEIAKAENELAEALVSVAEAKQELETLEGQKTALTADIEALSDNKTVLEDDIRIAEKVLEKKDRDGERMFGTMARWKQEMSAEKERDKAKQKLDFFEWFINLPTVRPAYEAALRHWEAMQGKGRKKSNEQVNTK